jgi:hypothetical protein
MSLLLAHPPWAALAGLLLAAGTGALVATRRSWRWKLTGLALPTFAAVCITLALADPALSGESRATAPVVILLDLSPSTRTSPWRDPAWLRRLALGRLGLDRQLTLVSLSGQRLAQNLTPRDPWPAEWPSDSAVGSTLHAAFAFRTPAESAAPSAALAPRWLLTDALLPRPQAPAPFPLALTLLPPKPLDLAVTAAEFHTTAPDAPIELLLQVRARGPVPSRNAIAPTLRVARDGTLLTEQPVPFTPDADNSTLDTARWITLRDLAADRALPHRYEVSLTGIADPWPENNTATLLYTPAGERRILAVGAPNPLLNDLATSTIPPERLPTDPADLVAAGWQVIVLNDVPAAALPPMAADAIDRFVRDTGGGLLFSGGADAFGPGGYAANAPAAQTLEALSPVFSRPHAGDTFHLVLLLDASASMNGSSPVAGGGGEQKFRILARAVADAAGLLADDDRLTAITFNSVATVLADGPRRTAAPALASALAAITPQGGTVPDTALPLLEHALSTPSPRILVVLLTDGDIPSLNLPRWQSLAAPPGPSPPSHPVPFALIAPRTGDGALARLARALPGTTWSATGDPAAWSSLLQALINARVTGQSHADPLPWRTTAAYASSALRGSASPWITTWSKPEAILLAQGATGDRVVPAAALAQRGLGTVAALPLTPLNDGAHRTLLRDLLTRLAPPAGDRRFTLSLQRSPEGPWILAADVTDPVLFRQRLSLSATILPADNTPPVRVPLVQTAAGHYEAPAPPPASPPAPLPAPFHATITCDAPLPRPASAPATASSPTLVGHLHAPRLETAEWPATVSRPLTAADFPGATLLSPSLDDPAQWNPPLRTAMPLAPALLLLAAIACVTALCLRR